MQQKDEDEDEEGEQATVTLHRHSILGPYNTARHDTVFQDGPEQTQFVVIWDNVIFHQAAEARDWFTNHNRFIALNLPPYTPFFNSIEELFSAWCWKVYEHQRHIRMSLQAMEEACSDIEVRSIQGWIRHARQYLPHLLGKEGHCLWCGWGDVAIFVFVCFLLLQKPEKKKKKNWNISILFSYL